MPDVKVVNFGEHVYFGEFEMEDPMARSAIMRIYEQWLHRAEPHVKTDNQDALRFLFQELTKKLRAVIAIPQHLDVIAVKGMGFADGPAQTYREVYFTVGILAERQRVYLQTQHNLENLLIQNRLNEVFTKRGTAALNPVMRDAVVARNKKLDEPR